MYRELVVKQSLWLAAAVFLGLFFLHFTSYVNEVREEVIMAPSGESLWIYITKDSPYTGWRFWPGKKPLYKGTAPHGVLLTTYVNDWAFKAIEKGKSTMPYQAVIVKENYMAGAEAAGSYEVNSITAMYKARGYNPPEGDWFWAKYSPNGEVLAVGSPPTCINCHSRSRANDYLMTEYPG